jgi:hypothetical protein
MKRMRRRIHDSQQHAIFSQSWTSSLSRHPRKTPSLIWPELVNIANQDQDLVPSQYWWEEEEAASLLPNSMYSFLCDLRVFLTKYDQWLVKPLDVLTSRFDTV